MRMVIRSKEGVGANERTYERIHCWLSRGFFSKKYIDQFANGGRDEKYVISIHTLVNVGGVNSHGKQDSPAYMFV